MELTQELVKSLFDYRGGILYWKVRCSNRIKIGAEAGFIKDKKKDKKRRSVLINKKSYYRSRIIFLWHHGWLPEFIDHEDRNQLNDGIENLRAATKSQNNKNKESRPNSTSKYIGVSWSKNISKWRTQIQYNGMIHHLGYFFCEDEAAKSYNEVAKIHHGEFANLNIIKPSKAA